MMCLKQWPNYAKIEFVRPKTNRKLVKQVRQDTNSSSKKTRGNQRNWNNMVSQRLGSDYEMLNKSCYECGSFNHLIKDCVFHEKKMVQKPVWNNAIRVNHQNLARMTHPHPKRNFVPTTVLTTSGKVQINTAKQNCSKAAISVNTARPVNTAFSRSRVNGAKQMSNTFNKAHSSVGRPFNKLTAKKNSNYYHKVNTVKGSGVNTARLRQTVNTARPKAAINVARPRVAVNTARQKAVLKVVKGHVQVSNGLGLQKRLIFLPYVQGNPEQDLQERGIFDSGCSRHMTGNKSYLTNFEEINGGFVAFGGNSRGGKITGKGKIRTAFKLTNENHVLLKVPRKDNMYSVDLKNIVPKGGLTCLYAKATSDESNLCHRRLGHINFKTLNKLVKGNLVIGFPLKLFEINQTCIACQKGKQYRASCKSKAPTNLVVYEAIYEEMYDSMERAATTATSLDAEQTTGEVKKVNREAEIHALIDRKQIIVSESTIRSALQFGDEGGVECLSNSTIFEEIERIGYEKPSQKLIFYKAFFSPQWKFMIHTILQCLSAKTIAWNEFSSTVASAIICLATNQKFNFSKFILEGMLRNLDAKAVKFLMYPRMKLNELMILCTNLQTKFLEIEKTKSSLQIRIESLERKVKKLEKGKKIRTYKLKRLYKVGLSARVISSDDEETVVGDQEDASKQGEEIADINEDENISLVDEVEGRKDDMLFDVEDLAGEEVVVEAEVTKDLNEDEVTLAQTLQKMKSITPREKGVVIREREQGDTQRTVIPKQKTMDKGKGKMVEPEKPLKVKDQISFDEQEERRLQALFDE
ncbi:putative ribonuclease H-like domain-containing protein [Tanacetum coccineum]